MDAGPRARLRVLAGLLLAGQGLLVVTGVLDHEAPYLLGAALLALGLALAAWPGRGGPGRADPTPPERRRARVGRGWLVAMLGMALLGAVLGYNAWASSDLALPEVAALLYGAALLAAAPRLGARVGPVDAGTLVAYSFPLVLAPLGLWGLNASLDAQAASTPMRWYIQHLLVAPMAAGLGLAGFDAAAIGDTVRLATPRGALFLTVGVVCAGLYAGVLFLGVFALFAWEARTPPPRLLAYLALGLAGLVAANVARLVLLGAVGVVYGGAALQEAHQHAGWALFLAWMVVFWALVLRRFEGPARAGPAG